MSAIATSRARQRYDAFTLTLHWLTAACVIFLLVSSACLIFRAGLPSIPRCATTLAGLHNNVAWALIVLALAHAIAALFHHYLLRDNVLRRMLPQAARRA